MAERIPFRTAVTEPLLLKPWFDTLSPQQQAVLKVFYGCPLSDQERLYWSMFQGGASYDPLGEPTAIEPRDYTPQEYERGILILGRRSGKSFQLGATIVTYEAALGGHEDYVARNAEHATCFLIAQDVNAAKMSLNFIRSTLESSPLIRKEFGRDDITADTIRLHNGIRITVAPPNIKAVRGYAVPVVVMDEIGFWYKTAESANPDYEVERAVRYAQAQFPHRKRVLISSPYIEEGVLYDYARKGTHGKTVVLRAPSMAMGNPLLTREWAAAERAQDAEAFERECLARFVRALSGFLSPTLLEEAVESGVVERAPDPQPTYVAALDPAFRRDAFAFTIVHHDERGHTVQDVLRTWKARSFKEPLNPAPILDEITSLLAEYRITSVASDQYQLEALKQLALDRGWTIYGVDFTGTSKTKIFGSLQQVLNQRRLHLLDHPEQIHELTMLERKYTAQGNMQITAPKGRHDDIAAALALACHQSTWLLASETAGTKTRTGKKTPYELCWETIKRHQNPYANHPDAW